jgi:hypothetical protein
MSCLQRSIRIAEIFSDLVRGDRPRPAIRVSFEVGTHHIGATWIELQVPLAIKYGQLYDHKIAELVEAFYQLPFHTLGFPEFTHGTSEMG